LKNESIIPKKLSLQGIDQVKLFGQRDENLRFIENIFDAKIIVRGNEITLLGEQKEVDQLEIIFKELINTAGKNSFITVNDISTVIDITRTGENRKNDSQPSSNSIIYTNDGAIAAKSEGQQKYYEAVRKNDIVFVIGPAGSGKTYLAVAMALSYLRDRVVNKIVLARPAVEAGESLGYLPGDILDKVDPYFKPLYDALFDMLTPAKLKKYIETEIIEIVPLAYMRGRTLNNAFVILDEAQNTYPNQMKMFLTRLGVNSRAIITGDVTQIDLPNKKTSGLLMIREILQEIEGIDFVYLTERDVVRHRLVREIIKAYDKYDENEVNK
jgi:phosphate starvation-inducible protein PhoH and related proteins